MKIDLNLNEARVIQDALDAKLTTGTIAPLIVSGAYPLAC